MVMKIIVAKKCFVSTDENILGFELKDAFFISFGFSAYL
jgi:hypothetical protein